MFNFNSQIKIQDCKNIEIFAETRFIKNEPMLFSCDLKTAYELGGPLTHKFLENLNFNNNDVIIDSRVHMLMPGWFPAIPGFHHDDVPRNRKDGQPDYYNPDYLAKHAMCIVSDNDVCPTEFAIGKANLPDVELGQKFYKVWHPIIIQQIKDGTLKSVDAPFNKILYFDWQTLHQGVAAKKNGWRWFIRATTNTKRKPVNELRRQTQVYLENPMEGW